MTYLNSTRRRENEKRTLSFQRLASEISQKQVSDAIFKKKMKKRFFQIRLYFDTVVITMIANNTINVVNDENMDEEKLDKEKPESR